VVLPEASIWTAGARWYRCDVVQLTDDGGPAERGRPGFAVERTGSLRGVLAKDSPQARTCFQGTDAPGRPVRCDRPHRFEYVGAWAAPWTGPGFRYEQGTGDEDRKKQGFRACRARIAAYVGLPKGADLRALVGASYRMPPRVAWERGDRGVRCYLYSARRDLKRSLKGTGTRFVPL
jgi:hypothetical protein